MPRCIYRRKAMNISEIMTPRPETIRPDATIREAADRMRVLDIGFLAVCNGDKIVGTVTDRDITVRHVAFGLESRDTQVREVMSTDVFYCFDDQDIDEVGQSMAEKEVKRMLILN